MDTGLYHSVSYPLTRRAEVGPHTRTVWRDYLSLLKPRTVLLHMLTAAASMFLAAGGSPSVKIMALVLLGGGLSAGAANTLNCFFDRNLDKTMARTHNRPLPSGRLAPAQAFIFGISCAVIGLTLLAWISITAAALALGALLCYVLAYTLWLKRNTRLSAVLSSGIGAVPPLIGWIAITGHLSLTPFLLFGIIALWTPPHFWSLALARGDEYKKAGLSVLPRKPAIWITGFSVLLVAFSLALAPAADLNLLYSIPAAVIGVIFVRLALQAKIENGPRPMRILYRYSIFYLVLLFVFIAISQII